MAESAGVGPVASKFLALGSAAVLLFSMATPMATATKPIKPGSICLKQSQITKQAGRTFECKRSGSKLVWRVKPQTTSVAPVAPVTPTAPTFADNYLNRTEELERCRLRETKNFSDAGAKGFPIRNSIQLTGNTKIAVIPVDFANAPGDGNPGEMYSKDISEIADWSSFFTRSKMTYQPQLVSKTWLRAPRGAEWYVCVYCGKGATATKQPMDVALQELITLADPLFDFENTKFVYFIFPLQAERDFGTSLYFHRSDVQTNEGPITISVYGEMGGSNKPNGPSNPAYNRVKIWDHLIHEILHFQGFVGHGPINGSDLNIMTNQWGGSKTVTSWEAFLAGWYSDNEIKCFEKTKLLEPIYITMSAIDLMGHKPISTMIRLSDEEVIVIEKRQNGKYSNFDQSRLFPKMNNFTAYYVNVNTEQYRNDADPDAESKNFWRMLREDGKVPITKSVSFQGVTIEVTAENQVKIFSK
ncbi:MAG: hypothetical protein GM45_1535 [actinobacterium acAMD-5]|nr:MAG: hypothetical protein GM45_1535 [actinobacterium acAMD-5]